MRRVSFLLVLLCSLLTGCDATRTYDVQGRIAGFGDDGRTVFIEHEDIPGLMPAMTMPFTAAPEALQAVSTGDAVAFTFHVARDSSWITDLALLPDSAVARQPAGARAPTSWPTEGPAILQRGDRVPPFTLQAQDGDTLRVAPGDGTAYLLTFIYTRCPIPDYCPLLSQQFQRLQPQVQARYGDAVHLLSVSFDPAYDTPEVLRAYAARYTDDLSNWTFATGDAAAVDTLAYRFGVTYVDGAREITHNLATALIGPDGRVAQLWRGNDWRPDDVLRALSRTLPERSDAGS